jgi:urease accessory protein
MATIIETSASPHAQLMLLALMSPAFPTGGFAYSHGLERAIDDGVVKTADDVYHWIEALLKQGSGWNDAVIFACAHHANENELLCLDALALALAASKERAMETTDLGQSFAKAAATLSSGSLSHYKTYPLVVAAACRNAGIPLDQSLSGFMQAFSNNLITVAVRLVPLGQTQGLDVMRQLMLVIIETCGRAARATVDDLGSSTLLSDIASMQHETQYSRVFRT